MTDVISLVASVITIAAGVNIGVKYAKACSRAREELEALETRVEQFSTLVKDIDAQQAIRSSAAIAAILAKAKLTLERLGELVQNKLLKNVNGTSRARRRAWARNKSRVYRIQAELKEYRANLTAAVSTNNTVSANCSKATLSSINDNVNRSKEISLSLDKHLSEVQQVLTKTYHAVVSQSTAVSHLLQSISVPPEYPLKLVDPRFSLSGSANQSYPNGHALTPIKSPLCCTNEQKQDQERKSVADSPGKLTYYT
ncbi:MAG: hypothetical protein Q9214_001166 [Letrouitia sp. 1 TL-2023]